MRYQFKLERESSFPSPSETGLSESPSETGVTGLSESRTFRVSKSPVSEKTGLFRVQLSVGLDCHKSDTRLTPGTIALFIRHGWHSVHCRHCQVQFAALR